MTTSESVADIASALAKAQASMKNAPLNKVNPHFKSKFADLASVRDAVIPALAANGIAVVQTLDASGVVTRLLHVSGQWIESTCPIPPGKNMQEMGSAITYARRYSLSAICGIAADEDDDANEASTPGPSQTYAEWLADIEAVTAEGYDALIKAVSGSHSAYKDELRKNRTLWSRLEAKARTAGLVHA